MGYGTGGAISGYTRASANLILDDPRADGHTTVWGYGQDWLADEPRLQSDIPSASRLGQYQWQYNGLFGYLKDLKAILPLGSTTRGTMALADWTVMRGTWKESSAAGSLGDTFLHFYDGRPHLFQIGADGRLRCNTTQPPRLAFWVWRMPSADDEDEAAVFAIRLCSISGSAEYMLVFPAWGLAGDFFKELVGVDDGIYRNPYLLGRPADLPETETGSWALIDEWKGGGSLAKSAEKGNKSAFQLITIEYDDGWLLVSDADSNDLWAYRGKWVDAAGREQILSLPDLFPVEVWVSGHTAMFSMAQITYPVTAVLEPLRWAFVPDWMNQTPIYSTIRTVPAGTNIVPVAVSSGPNRTHPQLTFTSGPGKRPILYNVQEFRAATIADVVSAPIETEGNDDLRLISMSGRTTDKWQGATMRATFEATPGHSILQLKANCKVQGTVSLDQGVTDHIMFTGYAQPLQKERIPGPTGLVRATMEAADLWGSRLDKKIAYEHCSYEDWKVDEAFQYMMNRFGVADSLLDIEAWITEANMGSAYFLPASPTGGDRRLKFENDTPARRMLEETFERTRNMQVGVNVSGRPFLRRFPGHTPGHYDFTLDDDTLTLDDTLLTFRSCRNYEQFHNVLLLMVGQGDNLMVKLLFDWASINTSTASNFTGDDWWRYETCPDGDQVEALALRLWMERDRLSRMIFWSNHRHPDWLPDHEVRVQVSSVDVTTDSVFKITAKDWSYKAKGLTEGSLEESGEYECAYEACIVEEGP